MSKWFMIFSAIIILTQPLFADQLDLNDGAQITGTIKEIRDDLIVIETDNGLLHIQKNKVMNVTYQSNPTKKTRNQSKNNNSNSIDSWYIGLMAGLGSVQYLNDLDNFNKSLYQNPNNYESKIRISFLFNVALYLTASDNILIGAGYSYFSLGSHYEYVGALQNKYSSYSEFFYADFKLFFDRIGSGAYISLSPGASIIVIEKESTSKNEFDSEIGYGIKIGVGYSVPLESFGKAFMLGLEGIYMQNKHKTETAQQKWGIAGGYLSIGWLW